ncbi:MAG TPA: tyrosine-type recombinase/integrase [Candidatus Udaeobacter sp.]|jgi:integrase
MPTETISNDAPKQLQKKAKKTKWRKVGRRWPGLYQSLSTGTFRAVVRAHGKLYRESLRTKDLAFAKRLLADFKRRLERTQPRYGRITLAAWLQDVYFPTLRGSPGTLAAKRRIIERVKAKWLFARSQPMRDIRESQVLTFLNENYGQWSDSHWNGALTLLRDALAMAVRDHALLENPAGGLKYRKRKKPIRLTPTWEQFQAIITDVRSQPFNADALDSAAFLEAMGLLGLGQAELAGMKREHVDLASGRVLVYRHKTSTGFSIPIFPQARPLVERLSEGKKVGQHLFPLAQARKALTNACKRLGYPPYTHRSLRRMFITRCLEKGIDVKLIANWQGHKDQGVLILQTYSHVRPEHERHMAARLTTDEPANIVPIIQAKAS